ncbi:uncharacterized protein MELLADRAFT_67372 [Melampsora larici-populina 98AG31]|uniref:Uncharacterized protein n=1 Tax=Melampsora larici-populina (strain 98AG31 / pathotype 3-4-7) TaxID=747676 RepID=F4S2Y0_MELLP|nr:uncharacterized protein MELLADRAFT_67372 [Melampsora larici-populina 98AG31]EGG00881.1 hypothetical protein MELLADRAFT_67372 [Melampsora larici-populina 98AG31]
MVNVDDEIINATPMINDNYGRFDNRFAYFETEILIHQSKGVPLKIAARRDQSELQEHHAYRLDAPVAVWGPDDLPMLMEDFATTLEIEHAEVLPHCRINKVLAQGLGQIVEWSRRRTTGLPIEVIKVLHRCWNATQTQRVEFYANYLLSTNITSTLTMGALEVGNLISLRGLVVSYVEPAHTWDIQATEIQTILANPQGPSRRRSRRLCGLQPIGI